MTCPGHQVAQMCTAMQEMREGEAAAAAAAQTAVAETARARDAEIRLLQGKTFCWVLEVLEVVLLRLVS